MAESTGSAAPLLDREHLRALASRRDAPGLALFALQTSIFSIAAIATTRLAAAGDPAFVATATLCGVALLTFFPLMHETGHGTAFRSGWLNEVGLWVGAVAMLQAPSFFREFHWEHHRSTQDPEHDPEIAALPDVLDDWPRNPLVYLFSASGLPLMVGKLAMTLSSALVPTRSAFWQRLFPFLREERRVVVARESRIVVALLSGFVAVGLVAVPGFPALLLAWPISHVLLGLYLMPEHTGLPHEGSQLERTRSVRSNALVRWSMWNMPLHAEHHAYPGIPFHAVPRLHARLEPELVNVASGYLAFHREALRRCLGAGASSTRS